MAQLSGYFDATEIVRDGEFATLGYVDSVRVGTIAFADSTKYVRLAVKNPAICCLITSVGLSGLAERVPGLVVSENPRAAFYRLHECWVRENRYQMPFESYRGVNCQIHPSAIVAAGCYIGDHVVIGEQAVIRDPVKIGDHVIIEPGAKLGMEGILYQRTVEGPRLIKHGGAVEIGDHTAVLTNAVVVRAVHDTDLTKVGKSVIVGIGSVIGHEAKVEDRVVVSNQCVVARRCVVGEGAFLGTGVFVREHVKIGRGAQVMAGAVVVDDVAESMVVSGNFATDHQQRLVRFARDRQAVRGH
jgi:acyl-[acyl carrier protein]--UDP-N-acetylglucosamine O-acyltransferase